jgi:hypothetical protein
MSILKSTRAGMTNLPVTLEGAISLGWEIEKETSYKNYNKASYDRSVELKRKDVCAPLRFFWHDRNKKDDYSCRITLYFFGDVDNFKIEFNSSRLRTINTMGELKDCLHFLKEAKKYRNNLNNLWDKNMSKLEDPQKEYY